MEEATLGKRKTRKGYSSILQETGIFLGKSYSNPMCNYISGEYSETRRAKGIFRAVARSRVLGPR